MSSDGASAGGSGWGASSGGVLRGTGRSGAGDASGAWVTVLSETGFSGCGVSGGGGSNGGGREVAIGGGGSVGAGAGLGHVQKASAIPMRRTAATRPARRTKSGICRWLLTVRTERSTAKAASGLRVLIWVKAIDLRQRSQSRRWRAMESFSEPVRPPSSHAPRISSAGQSLNIAHWTARKDPSCKKLFLAQPLF